MAKILPLRAMTDMTLRFGYVVPVVLLMVLTSARAELIISDKSVPPQEFTYQHPFLRFLVFASPEARGQAILPPAPIFIAPPPLIWRAPGTMPIYPPPTPPASNQRGAPSNRDVASYNVARAHAMSQGIYRIENAWAPYSNDTAMDWFNAPFYGWGWNTSPYPPVAPNSNHPSNRDNASYLIDRAHRFSQDAYRKP